MFGNRKRAVLCSLAVCIAEGVLASLAAPASAVEVDPSTRPVSVNISGDQADSFSLIPAISANGRYVAFVSLASNLVPGDTNGFYDIFVRDRVAGTTQRVSISDSGAQADADANDGAEGFAMSSDGRYVTFVSSASNLVPGDTNGRSDVFVRDRVAGTTRRVSIGSNGAQADSFSFSQPAISAHGHYVAFLSNASNLVPEDTNGDNDVFVRDLVAGTTKRVSVSSSGVEANGSVRAPAISAHGRYVAFGSDASNLVPDDTNGGPDVFVRDRVAGTTQRVSVSSSGAQSEDAVGGLGIAISAHGRYVAFDSRASDLVQGDTAWKDVFVRDRVAGITRRVSVAGSGAQANFDSDEPTISRHGRYVGFFSLASNLVPGDTNGFYDVFVRDRRTGTTRRVSVSSSGVQANSHSTSRPVISAHGRYVAFASDATNLVPGDTNDASDVFVWGRGSR